MGGTVSSVLKNFRMTTLMGAAGLARVENEFNAADQCAKIESVLLELLTMGAVDTQS